MCLEYVVLIPFHYSHFDFFQNISGDKTFINALIEFFKINDDSYSGQPDHDSLRNILQNELENHKDEPNYDKFDWQI